MFVSCYYHLLTVRELEIYFFVLVFGIDLEKELAIIFLLLERVVIVIITSCHHTTYICFEMSNRTFVCVTYTLRVPDGPDAP